MALIEVKLAPAWKRVVTDDETETTEVVEESAEATEAVEPTTVEIVEEADEPDDTTTSGRRRLTLRRVLLLGVIVGAIAAVRQVRKSGIGMSGEEPTIDVETPDETTAER